MDRHLKNFNSDIQLLKSQIDKICIEHDVSFYGVFSNTNTNMEIALVNNDREGGTALLADTNQNASTSSSASSSSVTFSSSDSSNYNSYLENHTNPLVSNIESKNPTFNQFKMMNLNPKNSVEVNNYLFNCFEEFQQIPCKLLAKAWIKIVEPKKQSTYPYKAGDDAKPYWWPSDARHKEPDHLKKNERISLLVSLIKVFKNREAELIHSAGTINELAPKNRTTNTGDEFGSRKISILKDMFRIVKNAIEFNRNTISVIKPGKKYSSQIYQRPLSRFKKQRIVSLNEIAKNNKFDDFNLKISNQQLTLPDLVTSTPTKCNQQHGDISAVSIPSVPLQNLLNKVASNKSHIVEHNSLLLKESSILNNHHHHNNNNHLTDLPSSPSSNKDISESFGKYINKSNIDPKVLSSYNNTDMHVNHTKIDFNNNEIKANPMSLMIFKNNNSSPFEDKTPFHLDHTNALSALSPSQINITSNLIPVPNSAKLNESNFQEEKETRKKEKQNHTILTQF